jgi:hypothetical protein
MTVAGFRRRDPEKADRGDCAGRLIGATMEIA